MLIQIRPINLIFLVLILVGYKQFLVFLAIYATFITNKKIGQKTKKNLKFYVGRIGARGTEIKLSVGLASYSKRSINSEIINRPNIMNHVLM